MDNARDLLSMDLSIGGDDWVPTPHGQFLARVLAEQPLVEGRDVLELGAGSANHTIVMLRTGCRSLVATEITDELLETTRRNVEANCPDRPQVDYRVADWLDTPGRFDAIVTNPPFCKSGKQNRRYFIDSLILDGHKRLRPGGRLVFIQSSMADLDETRRLLDRNGYDHRVVDSTRGPFRDYYFDDETFMREIQSIPHGFEVEDGVHYERLYVLTADLRPFEPPAGAHIVA